MQIRVPLFRLRSVFIIVMILALLIPLAGIVFFRVYENVLVRQTESELISQAALIQASYKQQVSKLVKNDIKYGIKIKAKDSKIKPKEELFTPILPMLDLAKNELLPRRPEGLKKQQADSIALSIAPNITELFNDAQKVTLSGLVLLDYNGVALSGLETKGLSYAHVQEVEQALQGNYSSVIRKRVFKHNPALTSLSRGTGLRVFVALPIMQDNNLFGVVYLSRTPKNILKQLYAAKYKVIAASLILLLVFLAIAFALSATITRPIDKLIEKINNVNSGKESFVSPLEKPRTVEVNKLSSNFASITKLLHERSEYIKNFAAHVSHEFKTPITSINGASELLIENIEEMPKAKRDKFLNNILADTKRLQTLVMRLLELARADNYIPTNEESNFTEVVKAVKSNFEEQSFVIEFNDKTTEPLKISQEALQIVLTSLLDNSAQHGATKVVINAISKNNVTELIIADNGEGVSEANKSKIFTPFFTTKRNKGGTGLGLVIINSILKAHEASISICDSKQGAKFMVKINQK